jgi:hypothetical protein
MDASQILSHDLNIRPRRVLRISAQQLQSHNVLTTQRWELGSGTRGTYTCSNARRKLGCKNTQGIRREALERELLEAIATTIRSEANFAQVKSLFMAELSAELNRQKESAQKAPSQSEALIAEQKQPRAALHNLAEEVANFGGNEEMRSVRRRKEARLTVVTNLLKCIESPSKQSISEQEIDAFLRKAFAELADVLLGDPLTTQQELRKRISSLTLTPMVHNGEPAYEISGEVTLFCAEEVMMLLSSGTMTGEHHPFVIKLDGQLLKLDPHAKVTAIVRPHAAQADGMSICRPFESVEDSTARRAKEDTHLSLSPPWLGPPIDDRGVSSNQKQMA